MKHIEDAAQAALMQWAHMRKYQDGKVADYIQHSPNGGLRSIATAARLKCQGTMAGFPDLFLFVPAGGYHGLMIEMKAPNGRLSVAQKKVLPRIESQGYRVEVCYSTESAIEVIQQYLDLQH